MLTNFYLRGFRTKTTICLSFFVHQTQLFYIISLWILIADPMTICDILYFFVIMIPYEVKKDYSWCNFVCSTPLFPKGRFCARPKKPPPTFNRLNSVACHALQWHYKPSLYRVTLGWLDGQNRHFSIITLSQKLLCQFF